MKLIVGLGNPGSEYANHKHNIGFWVVEGLAKAFHFEWSSSSKMTLEAWGTIANEECWLVKPLTWMNKSGDALRFLLGERKASPGDLIVVHDDMDLTLGRIRMVYGSGDGGHNGVRSVIEALQTKDFYRLRLGIGRAKSSLDPADYVLTPFEGEDLKIAEELSDRAIQSLCDFFQHGLEWVQNQYH